MLFAVKHHVKMGLKSIHIFLLKKNKSFDICLWVDGLVYMFELTGAPSHNANKLEKRIRSSASDAAILITGFHAIVIYHDLNFLRH